MESLLIKSDTKNNQLIKEFALKLGASVKNLSDEDLEDISLGMFMDEIKTKEYVFRIMKCFKFDFFYGFIIPRRIKI